MKRMYIGLFFSTLLLFSYQPGTGDANLRA